MKAKIEKMKNEYGGEIGVIAIALAAVLAYAFWGSLIINN
jgi:hypothetical protein